MSRWCGSIRVDEDLTKNVEAEIQKLSYARRGRVAYALFAPTVIYTKLYRYEFGYGHELFTNWRRLRRLSSRLAVVIWKIRRANPGMTIGVVCEDFSLRWYLECEETIDHLIVDTPILSYEECEKWRDKLSVSGGVRVGYINRMTAFAWRYRWKMPFEMNELCAGAVPRSTCHCGVWKSHGRDVMNCHRVDSVYETLAARPSGEQQ
jgi:hypothetical protein